MTRLLVLRPEPGATATLERADRLGLSALSRPLFEIERMEWKAPAPTGFDGLLLTSANAVRHGGNQLETLRNLPVFAVGEATASEAREFGFAVAASGDSGLDRLLASIPADLRLVHLCGQDRIGAKNPRQKITAIPVYRAREKAVDLHDIEGSVALIHSPRAGARFAALVKSDARQHVSIAAISDAALAAAGEGWADAQAAKSPNDDALLALAARLCNKTAAQ
jgi:uroporphyrinogen-III synthase